VIRAPNFIFNSSSVARAPKSRRKNSIPESHSAPTPMKSLQHPLYHSTFIILFNIYYSHATIEGRSFFKEAVTISK
jgi:hypothetical protein